MLNKNITKLNKIAISCLVLFSVITLARIFNHVPWFDEAHGWTIAEQLNYFDMLNYIKNEGHFFVWQSLLYPFAKLHLYPYSMQLLNWIFCLIALIVMWWKAPFNNVVKGLITFSFPFLGCYGVIARCYSVGIMLLFILASMNDVKLKYPKTYATVLIFCANTSIMALIGASAFGLMFLYDLYKSKLNKNELIKTSGILFLGAFLVFIQIFLNIYFSSIVTNSHLFTSLIMIENIFIYHNFLLNFLINIIFAVPIFIYLCSKKQALFLFVVTYFLMLLLTFKFYGFNFWHSYFFYIYLLIALWISDKKEENTVLKKISVSIFAIISFILIFHLPEEMHISSTFHSKAKVLINLIENDEQLKNSVIIHNSGDFYEILPYTHKKTYKIKNYCTLEDKTDYDLKNSHLGDCVKGNIFGQAQKYPDLIKYIVEANNNNVFAFTQADKNPQIKNYGMIFAGNYNILIKKYKCDENLCFWKVEIK